MSERFGPYQFNLNRDEFLRYAQEVGRRQLAELDSKSWRLVTFAGLAVVAVLGGLAAAGAADSSTLTSGALASAGAILIGRLMMRRQIARSQTMAIEALAEEGVAFSKPVTLAIDDAGISIEMGGAQDTRPFSELRDGARLPGLLVFWSGPSDGVALPERALGGGEEGDAILAFTRSRLTPT